MNAHQMPALLHFACDSMPNCQGQITERIGDFVILEGMAADSGAWFTQGPGGPRKFNTRQEAADYIEYAMDALPPMNNQGNSYKGFSVGSTVKIKQDGSEGKIVELGDNGAVVQYNGKKEYMHYNEFKKGGASDEPIAADPEEVKKAWAGASAAAKTKKQSKGWGSGGFTAGELRGMGGDAEDCEGMDAEFEGQSREMLEKLWETAKRTSGPASPEATKIMQELAKRMRTGQDASDPKDILHQIESSYRNTDAPTISSERKKVIAIMDNAANPPAIREAAKDLLRRMNREEDKMHGDAKNDKVPKENKELEPYTKRV